MGNITMCGYRCDLCKAFITNIRNKDEREDLSNVWKKYYDLDIPADKIHCDGCRCSNESAKRIDMGCPVRRCVIDKKLDHCGECVDFPCTTFDERKGLSEQEAQEKLGSDFCADEYRNFLSAYDNMTRIMDYIRKKS